MFVSGSALSAVGRFYKQKMFSGTFQNEGMMHTTIRRYEELIEVFLSLYRQLFFEAQAMIEMLNGLEVVLLCENTANSYPIPY